MDIMNFRDILLVAIPEVSLSILIGLLLIKRQVFKQKEKVSENLFRFILSIVIVVFINRYSRIYISNIILVIFCTFIAYFISFFLVWRDNVRKSILVGCIITYMIVGAEILTLPIMSLLIEKFQPFQIFNIRFILSIPSRIVDILLIITTIIFNIEIKTIVLDKKWNDLKFKEKISVIGMLLMFLSVIFISANNSDLYVKLNQLKIDTVVISQNIQITFISIIFFMLISIILLYIIIKYYEYKTILSRTPEQIFSAISEISPPEKIYDYIKILQNYLLTKEVKNE